MVSWEYLWPTLRSRGEAGSSPLLSIGWWYLSSVSPKRHCCRVSAADKGCRVYPLDPRPDAVALYSGCTPGGEPKSVKRLRSGDLLIETTSDLQTKSFLLAKSFLNNPVTVNQHKTLDSCRGVISEPDLLGTPDSEILDGFSDQGVTQATKPSTISTTPQTDPNITNIICPPLQCLKPVYSENPMPSTWSSVSTVSTSSSSTQEPLLPSPFAIIPTIQGESLLKIPISTTTTTTSPGNNLNTSVSSLETETCSLTTPNKFAALSTEILPLAPFTRVCPYCIQ
ncbi:uncharacterized protein TNCV_4994051 [Trichonephila clavipes]|nr:uncharacterized protein TNCV_4994051 [Trichonephila clavipes]